MNCESRKDQNPLTLTGIPKNLFQRYYADHGRTFPWRREGTGPFGILVAEILLKQTHAEKVAQVWPSLTVRYPNVAALAGADPDDLFRLVSGLGLGDQRTRALIAAAKALKQAGGVLPEQPGDLMKLPYVGVYTAHAVACFALGQRLPIVDLSIVRVFSRIAGVQSPKDIRRAAGIWTIAWTLLPDQEFKEHNYGLLDFAAMVCKPRLPKCHECPIVLQCAFGRHGGSKVRES